MNNPNDQAEMEAKKQAHMEELRRNRDLYGTLYAGGATDRCAYPANPAPPTDLELDKQRAILADLNMRRTHHIQQAERALAEAAKLYTLIQRLTNNPAEAAFLHDAAQLISY